MVSQLDPTTGELNLEVMRARAMAIDSAEMADVVDALVTARTHIANLIGDLHAVLDISGRSCHCGDEETRRKDPCRFCRIDKLAAQHLCERCEEHPRLDSSTDGLCAPCAWHSLTELQKAEEMAFRS